MGAGASVKRSPSSLQAEIDKLRERELNTKEENAKEWDKEELKVISKLARLESERNVLAERLSKVEASLEQQREGWRRERVKNLALTYSSLPLQLFGEEDVACLEKSTLPITRKFPMVTIAQCDVVGFSQLVQRLKPKEVIRIIDHLHALMDEAFQSEDIFVMERHSDGCTAAAGLTDTLLEESHLREDSFSSLSLADSSYGSENYLLEHDQNPPRSREKLNKNRDGAKRGLKTASYYANQMATAVLVFLSSSTKVHIPLLGRKQLQLRASLHSGPTTAGVLGLQSALGANHIPQFKLLGPTVGHAEKLCRTGLALQIRVSKQCKELLSHNHEFQFERCPDYQAWANGKPIESYWLVGKSSLPVQLPSLNLAISLSDYEDTDI